MDMTLLNAIKDLAESHVIVNFDIVQKCFLPLRGFYHSKFFSFWSLLVAFSGRTGKSFLINFRQLFL